MICPRCGAQVPEGTKFCPKCGTSLKTICPNCGGEIPLGKRFCPYCGKDFYETPGPGKNKKKRSPAVMILAALLAVLVIGVAAGAAAYFLVFQKEPEVRVASEDREEEEREDADDADGEETEEDGEEAEEQETEAAAEEETLQGTEPAGIASQEAPAAAPSGAGSDREQPEETQAQRIIIIERETAASQPAQAGQYSYDTAAGEYIIPDSDSRYLSADELAAYSKDQLRLARNEIYARHGRRFSDEALQAYFDSCSWYRGTVAPENFDVNVLNDYEKENLLTIKDVEDQLS